MTGKYDGIVIPDSEDEPLTSSPIRADESQLDATIESLPGTNFAVETDLDSTLLPTSEEATKQDEDMLDENSSTNDQLTIRPSAQEPNALEKSITLDANLRKPIVTTNEQLSLLISPTRTEKQGTLVKSRPSDNQCTVALAEESVALEEDGRGASLNVSMDAQPSNVVSIIRSKEQAVLSDSMLSSTILPEEVVPIGLHQDLETSAKVSVSVDEKATESSSAPQTEEHKALAESMSTNEQSTVATPSEAPIKQEPLLQETSSPNAQLFGTKILSSPSPTIKQTSQKLTPTKSLKTNPNTTLVELTAQRDALLKAFAALPTISPLLQDPASNVDDSSSATVVMPIAKDLISTHIKLLHDYNEIKDIGQGLMGLLADQRGVRIVEVQEEFGVGGKD